MSWAAVAIGGATILANLYSQQQQANAQSNANSKNMALTREGIAEQARQFDISTEGETRGYEEGVRRFGLGREDAAFQDRIQEERNRSGNVYSQAQYQPYQQAGKAALDEYQAYLGLSGADAAAKAQARFNESPGQRFLRERQEKSLLRNASAMGGLRSGRTATALQEQAAGIASTYEGQYLDRLYGLSGQGLTATSGAVSAYRGESQGAYDRYGNVVAENAADRDARAARAEAERLRKEEEARRLEEERKKEEERRRAAAVASNRWNGYSGGSDGEGASVGTDGGNSGGSSGGGSSGWA